MAIGVTKTLTSFTGKVGRCEKDHVVEILSGGYGFCAECASEIDAYHTLYVAPEGFETPGAPTPGDYEV
tara:strand:- start:5281 stop:5487 length:207 start_codon:yes stop_codon:yes gene_type:complete